VKPNEPVSIARTLGKDYKPPKRSQAGLSYDRIRSGLSAKGLCTACASNIATAYVQNKYSRLVVMVDQALAGDSSALNSLEKIDASRPDAAAEAASTLSQSKSIKQATIETKDAAYNRVYDGLSKLGFWLTPAANFAMEYIDNPDGKGHQIIDQALTGDKEAQKMLQVVWVRKTGNYEFDEDLTGTQPKSQFNFK
jgi:hypothetical protein